MTGTNTERPTARNGRAPRTRPQDRAARRRELDGDAPTEHDGGTEAVATYLGISDVAQASRIGYWVDCPLPAYRGLRVLYRTNNPTRRRRERPVYREPYELQQQRQALAALNARLEESFDAEAQRERDTLTTAVIAANQAYIDEFRATECRWLSQFAIGFDGWTFRDIPQPDPDEPDSYIPLWQELEDLYFWLLDRGYSLALAEATKNY